MNETTKAAGFKGFIRIVIPVIVGLGGVTFMVLITRLLQGDVIPTWAIWSNAEVNFSFTLQMMMLPVSGAAVLFIYVFDRAGFHTFFRISFRATTEGEQDWMVTGPMLAIIFTAGTFVFMSMSVSSQGGQVNTEFFKLLPVAILLAATNAWTEEIFTRFVIVAGLHSVLPAVAVCWVSALVFGLPHFFGTPSGVFGMFMAGLLGWFLAKSVVETKSMTWALLVHFLQDLMIFGGGAMVIAGGG